MVDIPPDSNPEYHALLADYYSELSSYQHALACYHGVKTHRPAAEIEIPQKSPQLRKLEQQIKELT